jgi:hypothetical protein
MYVVSNCSNKDNMLKKLHKKYAADRVGILLLSHTPVQVLQNMLLIFSALQIQSCDVLDLCPSKKKL